MKIKENEVYTFKLNSGEELIAKVVTEHADHLIISEPVSVAPGPQGMGLVPSMFTANPKEQTILNTNSVAIYGLTDENVKAKYIEATTGITVPSKKLILG
jgi:hypothetical protein